MKVERIPMGGVGMPAYEYRCESCGRGFELTMSMAEYGRGEVRCPDCNSDRVTRQYSSFYARTSRKS